MAKQKEDATVKVVWSEKVVVNRYDRIKVTLHDGTMFFLKPGSNALDKEMTPQTVVSMIDEGIFKDLRKNEDERYHPTRKDIPKHFDKPFLESQLTIGKKPVIAAAWSAPGVGGSVTLKSPVLTVEVVPKG